MAMTPTAHSRFDAVVVDKENRAVALVEVKSQPVENWSKILQSRLRQIAEQAAFLLTVDPNSTHVYKICGESLGKPVVELGTAEILRHYDPDFPRERLFEPYLLTLVEAWLRDLAYHWKSTSPPGAEELRAAGMLEMLEGGTTLRLEV